MRRRDFIKVIAGSAAAWPLAARAQQGERMRLVGIFSSFEENDPEVQRRNAAIKQRLAELGWVESRNIRFDYRWATGNSERLRVAEEMVAQAPDVIFTNGSSNLTILSRVTRVIPIVFVQVIDPVGGGLVSNLARPEGNLMGFLNFEYAIAAKWLTLLKEIAPRVSRATILRDPALGVAAGLVGAIQGVAPVLGVESTLASVHDVGETERAIDATGRESNSGLIVVPGPATHTYRARIIERAALRRLPAIYPYRYFVAEGGLVSYGIDLLDHYRQGASYVDRILRGAKPGDLPIQVPTRYELAINLKTARALGLDVPTALLARTDEVIE
jgi:putative tryptophan/tyrosine transport system substrate-binding protein